MLQSWKVPSKQMKLITPLERSGQERRHLVKNDWTYEEEAKNVNHSYTRSFNRSTIFFIYWYVFLQRSHSSIFRVLYTDANSRKNSSSNLFSSSSYFVRPLLENKLRNLQFLLSSLWTANRLLLGFRPWHALKTGSRTTRLLLSDFFYQKKLYA